MHVPPKYLWAEASSSICHQQKLHLIPTTYLLYTMNVQLGEFFTFRLQLGLLELTTIKQRQREVGLPR